MSEPFPSGFHTVTLGCKLNQFDSAAIEGELIRRGLAHQPERSRAEVVVLNTCTVTHRADSDARKLIRSIRRENPRCKLLVTGCYAERDAEALRELGGADVVFGNRDKPRVSAILDGLHVAGAAAGDRGCDGLPAAPAALHFGGRARAFLKVQDGCRLSCSYCIIPAVRGGSRSVPAAEVLHAARALVTDGFREIVLTGVNTGDWGRDLEPREDLARLLRRLLETCGPTRIRMNSLEPRTITDEIVALMAAEPRLAPHLQVPLQSGCDAILAGMRRNYRTTSYRTRLEQLRRAVPHVGLGADVIVGFPGETEERFEETERFIAASPLAYLHVFSWSPRPGTPASQLDARVPPREIRLRSARLRALGQRLGLRFRSRFVGRCLDAVVLGDTGGDGRLRALTGNFIEVALPAGSARRREPVLVRVTEATCETTRAEVVGTPEWAERVDP